MSGCELCGFASLKCLCPSVTRKRIYSPYKTVNGKKDRISRHIMSESLGRALEPNEHVYHLNGDSTDNCIENLIVIKKKYNG